MDLNDERWFEVENLEEVFSPGLLVYEDRVRENIRRAIAAVGDPGRLRPHMKTHKMPGVIGLQLEAGITKFKGATIAEAEMAAQSGAPDVMLACQPAGPNARRLRRLVQTYPGTVFSTIADDGGVLESLSAEFDGAGLEIAVLLDVDSGMHRSGMAAPHEEMKKFYLEIKKLPGLIPGGLHVYDGHIREKDPAQRFAQCELEFASVLELVEIIRDGMLPVPRIVAGGSPTFPVYANQKIANLECSPGTFVFWDQGYSTNFPDVKFLPAALVLTRVMSRPDGNICFDLGHKAIASENPAEHRVHLIDLPDAEIVQHSEEHMVVRTAKAGECAVGDAFYGVPWHICPTVALYGEAVIVRHGKAAGTWKVTGRERTLGV